MEIALHFQSKTLAYTFFLSSYNNFTTEKHLFSLMGIYTYMKKIKKTICLAPFYRQANKIFCFTGNIQRYFSHPLNIIRENNDYYSLCNTVSFRAEFQDWCVFYCLLSVNSCNIEKFCFFRGESFALNGGVRGGL